MTGRPIKQTVDWFSHDATASTGKTLMIMYNNYGHEGISAWWQLLETLSSTNNHVIYLRNTEEIEFLSAKLHFTPERMRQILQKLADLEAIDPLLHKANIIWCQNLVDRLKVVYAARHQNPPSKPIVTDTYCLECGKLLVDMRSDAKFCSDDCRLNNHRNNLSVSKITDKNTENAENYIRNNLSVSKNAEKNAEKVISLPEKPISLVNNAISLPDNAQRKEKKRKEKIKEIYKEKLVKNAHGEFQNVLLTEEEYIKLKDKFNTTLEDKIEILSTGIASKGYKYKSHYAAILSWDRKEKVRNGGSNGRFDNRPKQHNEYTDPDKFFSQRNGQTI